MPPGRRGPRPPRPGSGYVSTLDAARTCGVSVFSIQRWFDEGLLTGATLPGGRRRIGTASLEAFMRKHLITAAPAGPAAALRVLLVDGDARLLGVMRETLAAAGCEVRTAASGLEAGLLLCEFKPELVVIDMRLEEVPGEILVRRLRESAAGRTAKVIALTTKLSDADRRVLIEAGASHTLAKPFAPADLLKAAGLKRPKPG